jgi:septal ring factor EnvC (AmiA/AmiB activator)
MSDAAALTVEILKQIRDGVFEVKAEVASLRNQVTYIHQEQVRTNECLDATNFRLESLRVELKEEIGELRRTVVRLARISDDTLTVSLEDSGRMDILEGRVRTLEAEVRDLRGRQ